MHRNPERKVQLVLAGLAGLATGLLAAYCSVSYAHGEMPNLGLSSLRNEDKPLSQEVQVNSGPTDPAGTRWAIIFNSQP